MTTTRQNTNEAYHAVKALHDAGRITLEQWQTYEALWHYGPLTSSGVNETVAKFAGAAAKPPWGRQLKSLVALGLIAPAANKQGFDVTSAQQVVQREALAKAKKPSAKKFKKGVEGLELLFMKHEFLNDGLATPEVQGVLDWLKGKLAPA